MRLILTPQGQSTDRRPLRKMALSRFCGSRLNHWTYEAWTDNSFPFIPFSGSEAVRGEWIGHRSKRWRLPQPVNDRYPPVRIWPAFPRLLACDADGRLDGELDYILVSHM